MKYDEILAELAAGTAAGSLPAWASRVLDEIDAGASTVTAVRHPLGFLCLPVERSGEYGVCLHIWTPEVRAAETTTSPVHCHSWDLVSFVLYGTVRNTRVAVEEAAVGVATVEPGAVQGAALAPGAVKDIAVEPGAVEEAAFGAAAVEPGAGAATHRIFEVASGPDGDELRATPRTVRYAEGDGGSSVHGTGDTYTLPAGVFHSTRIENGLDAATVALGRQTPGGGDLSLGPLDAATHHTHRQPCDPDEAVRAARRSARLLAAAHPRRPEPDSLGERHEPCAHRTT
ncbi:hypothetical protein J4573_21660 [Actinomadura barringtoniae]|uniref:Uncharacterized protein n=1 Tax=Actinomadura barringtoniae TaxID=1427535 RepID=A0A939T5N1_9ACTN|nr:hypothetical protein [Actinomadura barringtoniae]MBO2449724.1 hypothetical protein [Actinomadura barringtoniae]